MYSHTDDGIVSCDLSDGVLNAFECFGLTSTDLAIVERSNADGHAGLISLHDGVKEPSHYSGDPLG